MIGLFSCNSIPPEEEITLPSEEITQEFEIIPEKEPEKIDEEPSKTLSKIEIQTAETDISELIEKLNGIIKSNNFQNWKQYLSKDYIDYYSDPEVLNEKSQSPLLTKYKIVLRSLEDYFNYVVVGSRQNVKLDEIKALDRNRIKAYMFINNTSVIIYELVKIDNTWKIGKFLE
jgi:hypothetical protein